MSKKPKDMNDQELESAGHKAWKRANNPLLTHGSHVRNSDKFKELKAEKDRRES